jgi:RNA polymerase sigma-70 factor (ECF subfamily)
VATRDWVRARATPEQDHNRWDRNLIDEGRGLVKRSLRRNQPGPYQIQAAINAVHSDALRAADTDWSQILALYDQLLAFTPTARLSATIRGDGRNPRPRAALELIDGLSLERYHVYHTIRADLRRLGKTNQAEAACHSAIDRPDNAAEIAFLTRRMQALSPRRRRP